MLIIEDLGRLEAWFDTCTQNRIKDCVYLNLDCGSTANKSKCENCKKLLEKIFIDNDYTDQLLRARERFTVEQIPRNYDLVQDSQDVEAIRDDLTVEELERAENLDCFFVVVEDGEYKKIIGISGSVPFTHKTAYVIRS